MARYIDANAIRYKDLNSDMPTSDIRVWVTFKDWIDKIPTADVVEVVRCKDCVYYYKNGDCPFAWKDLLNDDEYCSYGERESE